MLQWLLLFSAQQFYVKLTRVTRYIHFTAYTYCVLPSRLHIISLPSILMFLTTNYRDKVIKLFLTECLLPLMFLLHLSLKTIFQSLTI